MAEHMLYPTEWPSHCIARLIAIGPSRLIEKKDESIKSALTVLCFIAGKTLGDPDAKPVIGEMTQDERNLIAADLDLFLQHFGTEDEKIAISGPITNALIERLLAIIIPMLLEWLEDWLSSEEEI